MAEGARSQQRPPVGPGGTLQRPKSPVASTSTAGAGARNMVHPGPGEGGATIARQQPVGGLSATQLGKQPASGQKRAAERMADGTEGASAAGPNSA